MRSLAATSHGKRREVLVLGGQSSVGIWVEVKGDIRTLTCLGYGP